MIKWTTIIWPLRGLNELIKANTKDTSCVANVHQLLTIAVVRKIYWAEDLTLLVEYLPSTHEALGLIPSIVKTDKVAHTCNPIHWEDQEFNHL